MKGPSGVQEITLYTCPKGTKQSGGTRHAVLSHSFEGDQSALPSQRHEHGWAALESFPAG